MSSIAMSRMLSAGMTKLSLSGASRSCLTRAFGTNAAVQSADAMPGNLELAMEKPTPPPRVIPTAQEAEINAEGNVVTKVISFANEEAIGAVELDPSVFNAPTRLDILQRVVRWQLACRRSGNHKSKTRSETSGSTRKPWKQKGSGRARVGDIRAPQWRGGYRVHGPVVRDHSYNLPKKVRAMGLRVALSTKLREGKLAIVDTLDVEMTKTKGMKDLLYTRGWDHALFLDGEEVSTKFLMSMRNLPYVEVLPQHRINVYSILQKDLLIITKDAVKYLEERLHTE